MFSKIALTATLAATLVLAPAALAHEVELDDVMLVDEDAAAGRDLLLSKTVSKTKHVTGTKPKTGRKAKKVQLPKVHRKKDIAGDEGDEGQEGDEGNEGNEGKDSYTVTKKTTVNSISCTANADAKAVAYARDAHVNAYAEAHKSACSGGKTKQSIVSVWEKDVAKAVAKAITSAYAKCTSTGNAYGCASAEAAAKAWASATASAHASAVADAVNYCHCKNAKAFAGAWASGTAGEFEAKIKADVAAKATGAVCVKSKGSGQTATAEVAVVAKCIEKKYAYVMAEATAKALIAGSCKYGLEAQAEIDALTKGKLVTKSNC